MIGQARGDQVSPQIYELENNLKSLLNWLWETIGSQMGLGENHHKKLWWEQIKSQVQLVLCL